LFINKANDIGMKWTNNITRKKVSTNKKMAQTFPKMR